MFGKGGHLAQKDDAASTQRSSRSRQREAKLKQEMSNRQMEDQKTGNIFPQLTAPYHNVDHENIQKSAKKKQRITHVVRSNNKVIELFIRN